jgi:hypothetical protein
MDRRGSELEITAIEASKMKHISKCFICIHKNERKEHQQAIKTRCVP